MKTLNISCPENLVFECQQLLKALEQSELGETIRLAIHFSDTSGMQNKVQLYQEASYVFVRLDDHNPLMYGNWEEALHATKRKITENAEHPKVVINLL